MSHVHHITHPLVQHKLTLMRNKEASTNSFRRLLGELSTLMAYEITRHMPLQEVPVETPLERTTGHVIDGKKLVLVSILRAGNGLLDGMLSVVPGARVGHIGLYRDPDTLRPRLHRARPRRCRRPHLRHDLSRHFLCPLPLRAMCSWMQGAPRLQKQKQKRPLHAGVCFC